ncbi:hypothetical protein ACWGH2_25715 [Streptomyces sp. NPDC054871]
MERDALLRVAGDRRPGADGERAVGSPGQAAQLPTHTAAHAFVARRRARAYARTHVRPLP